MVGRHGDSENNCSIDSTRKSNSQSLRPIGAGQARSSSSSRSMAVPLAKSSDAVSPPSYSVSEDEDGNLVNHSLRIVWPDRPLHGRYSLKNYYRRKERLLRQCHRLALREQRHLCREKDAASVSTAEEPSLCQRSKGGRPSPRNEPQLSSALYRSRNNSRLGRTMPMVSKSDELVSPPSYSVSEDQDGNLVNSALGIIRPDRPSFGGYSLKRYHRRRQKIARLRRQIARRELRRRQRQLVAESTPPAVVQSASCSTCASRKKPPSIHDWPATKPCYLGVQTATAMADMLRPTEFLLYHRQPERVNSLANLPLGLSLTLAYKTSRGELRNYLLVRTADNMWHVASGDKDPPTFASLKGLVAFYRVYGHVDPLAGCVDVFPWWLDE